jgi:small subunit ribosomal protein S7e
VHENILEDLVYPTEIVGKRIRHKLDGSKLIKIHLNHENKAGQDRIETYSKVYKYLTGKDVVFEFPPATA